MARKMKAALVLLIGPEGKEPSPYRVRLIRDPKAVPGPCWRLQKGSGRSYDVYADQGKVVCECKGFLRWGHCKHASAIQSEGLI